MEDFQENCVPVMTYSFHIVAGSEMNSNSYIYHMSRPLFRYINLCHNYILL